MPRNFSRWGGIIARASGPRRPDCQRAGRRHWQLAGRTVHWPWVWRKYPQRLGQRALCGCQPGHTNDVFISSFAYGTNSRSAGANVFYSTTGGASWTAQFSVPAPSNGVTIPNDWNFAYSSSGVLHGTILGGGNIYQGATANPTSLAASTYTGGGTPINTTLSLTHADQPWIALQGNNVFVAYDDFHSNTAERGAVSTNNGATFTVDNFINNGPQSSSVNPGTRIATDSAGKVYSIFGVGSATATPGVNNVEPLEQWRR